MDIIKQVTGCFSAVTSFLNTVLPFLRIGYREYVWKQSEFNAAVSYALRNAIIECDGNAALDYGKIMVARGNLAMAKDAKAAVANGKIVFTWADNSNASDAKATDAVMLLAYNKERKEAVFRIGKATRADGEAELVLPSDWDEGAMAVYLSFCSTEKHSVANSICLLDNGGNGSEGGLAF